MEDTHGLPVCPNECLVGKLVAAAAPNSSVARDASSKSRINFSFQVSIWHVNTRIKFAIYSCLSVYAEMTHKNNIKTLDERTVMNWYTQKPQNESESFAQSRTQFYKQFTQLQEFCDGRKSCNIPVNPKFFKGTIRQCIDRGTYRVRERFIKKCFKFPLEGMLPLAIFS